MVSAPSKKLRKSQRMLDFDVYDQVKKIQPILFLRTLAGLTR